MADLQDFILRKASQSNTDILVISEKLCHIQDAKPAPKGDQAAYAHTVNAPAPSLSLGGGLIYSPRCCSRSGIEHSWAAPEGACACVCVRACRVCVVRVGSVVCAEMRAECRGESGGVACVCGRGL